MKNNYNYLFIIKIILITYLTPKTLIMTVGQRNCPTVIVLDDMSSPLMLMRIRSPHGGGEKEKRYFFTIFCIFANKNLTLHCKSLEDVVSMIES